MTESPAPGIAAIYRELDRIGDVTVVAPDSHQSAMAHSITIDSPLSVTKMHVNQLFHGYAVGGSPADCVKLAVRSLMDPPPDLVVSGINDGANVSTNVLYSGTVAAAAEGALLGIPAVAVSLEHAPELDFDRAAVIARNCSNRRLYRISARSTGEFEYPESCSREPEGNSCRSPGDRNDGRLV